MDIKAVLGDPLGGVVLKVVGRQNWILSCPPSGSKGTARSWAGGFCPSTGCTDCPELTFGAAAYIDGVLSRLTAAGPERAVPDPERGLMNVLAVVENINGGGVAKVPAQNTLFQTESLGLHPTASPSPTIRGVMHAPGGRSLAMLLLTGPTLLQQLLADGHSPSTLVSVGTMMESSGGTTFTFCASFVGVPG